MDIAKYREYVAHLGRLRFEDQVKEVLNRIRFPDKHGPSLDDRAGEPAWLVLDIACDSPGTSMPRAIEQAFIMCLSQAKEPEVKQEFNDFMILAIRRNLMGVFPYLYDIVSPLHQNRPRPDILEAILHLQPVPNRTMANFWAVMWNGPNEELWPIAFDGLKTQTPELCIQQIPKLIARVRNVGADPAPAIQRLFDYSTTRVGLMHWVGAVSAPDMDLRAEVADMLFRRNPTYRVNAWAWEQALGPDELFSCLHSDEVEEVVRTEHEGKLCMMAQLCAPNVRLVLEDGSLVELPLGDIGVPLNPYPIRIKDYGQTISFGGDFEVEVAWFIQQASL